MHNYSISKTDFEAISETALQTLIVGARGYSGLELARLLLKHPKAKLKACFGTDASFKLSDYLMDKGADEVRCLPVDQLLSIVSAGDTVFLATPVEVSLELTPKLLEAKARVIDLSGAFRLSLGSDQARQAAYKKWYALDHSAPGLMDQAVYGIAPFAQISRSASLISNPGCYATAVLMGLVPLLKAGIIDPATVVIDAKSGTSGAGRKASEAGLFTEVDGDCLPYKVARHQHLPEITAHTQLLTGVSMSPHFTTHLLPVRRGITAGIYCRLLPGMSEREVSEAYAVAFKEYPLARVAKCTDRGSPLSLRRVVGSARTHIATEVDGQRLYVFSLIDNLLKGAASQAVENFNLAQGWGPERGLLDCEGVL